LHFGPLADLKKEKIKNRNMKSDVMGIAVQLSKQELKALTKETKETLAMDFKPTVRNRSFGCNILSLQ
jgi:hypothetical protein